MYSLRYLLLISKATNLSSTVELYLQPNDILAIKYRIGTVGSAVFALAPQVEEAEECPQLLCHSNPNLNINLPKASKYKRPVRRKKRVKTKLIEKICEQSNKDEQTTS